MPSVRKIYKVGHSTVIAIPGWMLEMMGWKVGNYIELDCYPNQMISISGSGVPYGHMVKSAGQEEPLKKQ